MKKICYIVIAAALFLTTGARAQEQDETARQLDSLQQVVARLSSNVETLEQTDEDQAIWKDRAKYFNLGYVNQTLTDKVSGWELKSDFGVSLSNGKTYYLHKKPLARMIKFGLDFTWMDINYAKSTLHDVDLETGEDYTSAMHQAEIGMQVGPSVTINPVHQLKVSGYFRVTPSYSMLYMDETVHHHYITMCNAGFTVAWKVISLGAEWRWGTAKYDGLTFDESVFEDEGDEDTSFDDVLDQFSAPKRKFKTSSVRFYIGFRF